jgi:hypothetical protein
MHRPVDHCAVAAGELGERLAVAIDDTSREGDVAEGLEKHRRITP